MQKNIDKQQPDANLMNDAIMKDIRDSIQSLAFGVVEIKVHNSKIIQIEVTHKKRFDRAWHSEGDGI